MSKDTEMEQLRDHFQDYTEAWESRLFWARVTWLAIGFTVGWGLAHV